MRRIEEEARRMTVICEAAKASNAEPKRSDLIVPSAATVYAPDVVDNKRADVAGIEKLGKILIMLLRLKLWIEHMRNTKMILILL
nr:5'-adenylylsulfate reductase 3, chloroplastic-like [Tanacetum cinerariifolium]